MKFEWEEISNSSGENGIYYNETFRAKVIGGWLVRVQTYTDYQYRSSNDETESAIHYLDEEGFVNVTNTMTFVSDLKHEWQIEEPV